MLTKANRNCKGSRSIILGVNPAPHPIFASQPNHIEQMELAITFTAQEQALYSAHLDFFRFVHKLSKAKSEARAREEIISKRPKRRWGFSL